MVSWIAALFLLPLVFAEGITVMQPTGVPVNGTTGVGWYAWVANDSDTFNVSFGQRTYGPDGNVTGEIRTLVCENVIGHWCDADTTIFADGTYAAIVTSGERVGYSNDFQILNHPPHPPTIVVVEPRGIPVANSTEVSWNASDPDGRSLSFTAFLVQRTYGPDGNVTGEMRTPLCTTTASNCSFDSTLFTDGTYVVAVAASDQKFSVEGYSNNFLINNGYHTRGRNALPAITVIEPTGVALSNAAKISWIANDSDNDALQFTAYLAQRQYDANHSIIGEAATEVCATNASKCEFDTRNYANGDYIVIVDANDGYNTTRAYSNDFTITNAMMAAQGSPSLQATHGRGHQWFLPEAFVNTTNSTSSNGTNSNSTVASKANATNATAVSSAVQENLTQHIQGTQDIVTSSLELMMQQPPASGHTDIQAPPTHTTSHTLAPAWALLLMASMLIVAVTLSVKL
jgi:hypothetical protein